MQDVARLAQVSLITVSRAINTPERVAPTRLARQWPASSTGEPLGAAPPAIQGATRST